MLVSLPILSALAVARNCVAPRSRLVQLTSREPHAATKLAAVEAEVRASWEKAIQAAESELETARAELDTAERCMRSLKFSMWAPSLQLFLTGER